MALAGAGRCRHGGAEAVPAMHGRTIEGRDPLRGDATRPARGGGHAS